MTKRVLIFGAAGQVGTELQRLAPADTIVVAVDRPEADIRRRDDIARVARESKPHVVFNCAAFTNVDAAEAAADEATSVNAVAAGAICEISHGLGARTIHVSTDYVFDGTAHVPYATDASPAPLSTYGMTKLDGERRVLAAAKDAVVVRTAWLHSSIGANFVKTATRVLTNGSRMRVVDDQVGTPTRSAHLARALWAIAEKPELTGILHFTDAGVASWYDVAVAVMGTLADAKRLPSGAAVEPIESAQWPTPARRPAYSVLDKHSSWQSIGFTPPHWRDGVIESTRELLRA